MSQDAGSPERIQIAIDAAASAVVHEPPRTVTPATERPELMTVLHLWNPPLLLLGFLPFLQCEQGRATACGIADVCVHRRW